MSAEQRRLGDRHEEERRYDHAASAELEALASGEQLPIGYADLAPQFHRPYKVFESHLERIVHRDTRVLELGAGTGRYTALLSERSRNVIALDISLGSLKICSARTYGCSHEVCADIERLPIADQSVDVLASAGSLSYGSHVRVLPEIRRVLRPGGSLLVVDSLNHNPIYKGNRWMHYRRGRRSLMTIENMPSTGTIAALSQGFEQVFVHLSGGLLFLHPAFRKLLGEERALRITTRLDQIAGGGKNAFKFVLVAEGFTGKSVLDARGH